MAESSTSPKHTNRLIHETSPYLLQHAHNPVDWYPWGEEALKKARAEDRLILLSIGYSACHWCHVMERESFEDETTAALMNEKFVNVKVDREERPDIDEIYMAATVAMNRGQGGWPMTVFLTPELEPVFAGTYFPPYDMHGRPGFTTVLTQVAEAWRRDRETLRSRAGEFAEHLRRGRSIGPPLAVGEDELESALADYKREFDREYGGFGSAPKFPPAVGLSLLLRLHRRFRDPEALEMVRKTLDSMGRGGMYDHVGGGFARYSTDRRWLVPHFEKMLYDNALLAKAYIEGYQATSDDSYRRVATETLDYIIREMTAPEGGIYSSTDADSEGEEGKFFIWTPDQIAEILDEDEALAFNAYYDITPGGNWEGSSIPNTPRSLPTVAEELNADPETLQETLRRARVAVYAARERRPKPGLDDKILTAWNGLMIGAFAEGYRVFRDPRYLEAAERTATFVLRVLSREDGGLLRTFRAGAAHLHAYLEDYAYLSEGLLDLYEAGGEARWLSEAARLMERTLADFRDAESGAFYTTAHDHEELLLRYQDGADGAIPAGNAVAAYTLARLSYHLDREDLRSAAVRALKAYGPLIERHPRGFAKSLCAVDFLLEGPTELAIIGRAGSPDREALEVALAGHHLPNRIQAISNIDGESKDEPPLLAGKTLVDGKAALYICRDYTCQAPVTDPDAVAGALEAPHVQAESTKIGTHLKGLATRDGTARYAGKFDARGYRSLGRTGLTSSIIGFGGYRLSDQIRDHRRALREALLSGVNLIDTSTNYMDGASERLVGGVLRELVDAGELSRDEIIVVSKIGYVQGENYQRAVEREERGSPFPEMVKYAEGLWHSIHPEFLEDQLRRSLDRLELETLDFCLLHNPEYFLSHAARRGEPLDRARAEFYRRVAAAFAFFETCVAAGRLSGYGVSSNTAVARAAAADATSLSLMLNAAQSAAGAEHHFRILQIPLNLFEAGAVLGREGGAGASGTVLELARADEIAVLANRPLNTYVDGALHRLADVAPEAQGEPVDVSEQFSRIAALEKTFRERIVPTIPGLAADPTDFFRLAERLRDAEPSLHGLATWQQVEDQIHYMLHTIVVALNRQLEGEAAARWSDWRDAYIPEVDSLLRGLRASAAARSRSRNDALGSILEPLLPEERRSESLSRKALWIVASTPGVTCVLNGMRQPAYVRDATGIMAWPPLNDVEEIYRKARSGEL